MNDNFKKEAKFRIETAARWLLKNSKSLTDSLPENCSDFIVSFDVCEDENVPTVEISMAFIDEEYVNARFFNKTKTVTFASSDTEEDKDET